MSDELDRREIPDGEIPDLRPGDFIARRADQTTYNVAKRKRRKKRVLLGKRGRETFRTGSASRRLLNLPRKYLKLAPGQTPTYKAELSKFLSGRRIFTCRRRKEIGADHGRDARGTSVDLRKGEYLSPMATDKSKTKSTVKRLPPDRILEKLSEIPEEQRNVLTPTLDAMLEEAKIIIPAADTTTDEFGKPLYPPKIIEGKELVLLICRNAAYESKTLLKFIHSWEILHELPLPGFVDESGQWKPPTWEEICHYAGIAVDEFLGEFTAAAHRYGTRQAKLVVDLSLARVVKASVERATTLGKDGFQDTKLLMEAGGMIQSGGNGVNVNIDNRSVNVIPGAQQGLPDWRANRKVLEEAKVEDVIEIEVEILDPTKVAEVLE